MTHEIIVHKNGIVEIVHTGQMSILEASESRTEAAAIMTERGLLLALADVSQTVVNDSTLDLLNFNESHYDVFPPFTRLAVVIPPNPMYAETARFAETVAVNRNILMRIFLKKEEAIAWLQTTV